MSELKNNIYPHDASYALQHDQMDEYQESMKLNIACKKAVEDSIMNNFDGEYLNENAADEAIKEFGLERVNYVLATTVVWNNWDGRYSRDNKKWARNAIVVVMDSFDINECREYVVTSHPAVLNGFINLVRKNSDILYKYI